MTGIDLTAEFCAVGRRLTALLGLSERVVLEEGDALSMPFAGATFDGAYSMNVSMNIADKAAFYREILRVLRPGGWLVLSEYARGAGPDPDTRRPGGRVPKRVSWRAPKPPAAASRLRGSRSCRSRTRSPRRSNMVHAAGRWPSAARNPPTRGSAHPRGGRQGDDGQHRARPEGRRHRADRGAGAPDGVNGVGDAPPPPKPRAAPPGVLITATQVQPRRFEVLEEVVGSLENVMDPKLGSEVAGKVIRVCSDSTTFATPTRACYCSPGQTRRWCPNASATTPRLSPSTSTAT